MIRETIEPTRSEGTEHSDYEENHPAFGVAVVTRSAGTPRTLFQSDLQHNETIVLSIRRASRDRQLMRDWIYPREELIEVEMSLAQWGSLVSSMGIGSGTPVTIRSTATERLVPGLPYEPRIATVVGEAKGTVERLLERARETLVVLSDAIESKKGIRETREALRMHRHTLEGAANNAEFAVKSVVEATEHVTSQAKSDIEAHILNAAALTGLTAPIILPELTIGGNEEATE